MLRAEHAGGEQGWELKWLAVSEPVIGLPARSKNPSGAQRKAVALEPGGFGERPPKDWQANC